VLVVLAGCGRIAFDPRSASTNDGSSDATATCTSFGPWSPPSALALNTVFMEVGPTPSPDGLELVFHSDRPGGAGQFDLYVVTRASRTDAWGNVTSLTVANSNSNDENATFAPDGLTMWFTSDRSGIYRIYRTTRSAVGAAWTAPAIVSELTTQLTGPMLTKQGTELFMSEGPANNFYLVRSTYDGSTFSTPAVIAELATTPTRGFSGVSPDGLTLAYEGQRTAYEVWYETRSSIGGTFGAEVRFSDMNDGNANEDPEWAYDGTELFFASNRTNVAGNIFDLFVMTRSCL
jgi:Tol biopolymer transport system component